MIDHDQFFKHVVRAFFGDLLRIVVPRLAAELRADRPRFLESELFTNVPAGEHRRLDLVAEVQSLRGEPEVVLVHVEVEAQARSSMGRRLFEYAMQLWLEHRKPVVPIVLYLKGGQSNVARESLRIEAHGEELVSFTYYAFGLSGSQAEEYLRRPEPLAWGLAGLMRRGRLSVAEHKIACLSPILKSELDEARKFLLLDLVETYVELDGSAQAEYRGLLAEPENREVAKMELTWSGRIAHEAKETGREEGKRELLLAQLERRFGPLPEATVRRVEAIRSPDRLAALAMEILEARSLEDLGL